ncbi:hypothetical protein M405DRAFT_366848 [Rhizopogon salebrosus TDB-379]|nr:hypothetical protein M405DRAFT_366848 [Rhizopogon salebrosus TDB-379]
MFNFSTLTFFSFHSVFDINRLIGHKCNNAKVRFIGRKFNNAKVQSDIKHFPFRVGLLHQRRCHYHLHVLQRIPTAGSSTGLMSASSD